MSMTLQACNESGVVTGSPIVFENNLTWTDEYKWSPVIREVKDTIDGGIVVQEVVRANEIGRPVTLEGFQDMGWLSKTTVAVIYTLSCTPYQLVKLVMADGGTTITKYCRFAANIEFQPVKEMNQILSDSFWYYGKIPLQVAKVSI